VTVAVKIAAVLFLRQDRQLFLRLAVKIALAFFEYDEGGRRGHSKKLFKKRIRLHVKKFSFSSRVVDKWNSLTDTCVNRITVNNFKNYILKELEPETCEYYHV